MAPRLSMVVPIKDEWHLVPRLMRRVGRFMDETIWVLDHEPGPRELHLARRWRARVCVCRWRESFSAKINAGIDQASGDWILKLDVDELISEQDLKKLRALLERRRSARAFWVTRRNYSNVRNLWSDWSPNRGEYPLEERFSGSAGHWLFRQVRLFRRLREFRYVFRVHEMLRPEYPRGRFPCAPVSIHHFQFHRGDEADPPGKRGKARWYARLALRDMRENDDHPVPCYHRARELLDAGAGLQDVLSTLERAKRRLRRRGSRVPGWVSCMIQTTRAIACLVHGRHGNALDSLTPPPRRPDTTYMLVAGAAHGCAGRWRESARWFSRILRRNPNQPVALNGLGLARMAQGRRREALRLYRQACAANPRYAQPRANLRRALRSQ